MSDNVLEIRNLAVEFKTDTGISKALRDVSFDVPRGKVTAVVGESGSGKSVTANCIMRIIQPPGKIISGEIMFSPIRTDPYDIVSLDNKDPRLVDLRGDLISMVFQEPMTALSPVYTVGNQVAEAILCHRDVTEREAWNEAADMLTQVGIDDVPRRIHQYPFEFSGGMRQRVVIAILTLIRDLQRELNNSVLFITHDLGVVAQLADQVVVMYQGRVLEIGTVRQVLKDPLHPYSQGLLASIPGLASKGQRLETIASVVGDADLLTSYPLTRLKDGRQVSLAPDLLREFEDE